MHHRLELELELEQDQDQNQDQDQDPKQEGLIWISLFPGEMKLTKGRTVILLSTLLLG